MRMVRRAVLVAVLLVLLPTAAGAGSFVQVTDPNDVAGKLDLELVKGVRSASGQPITFTIRMQAPFAKADLGPASNWVKVFLNVDVDANVDYVGTIKKTGTTLSVFFRGQGNNFEALPVLRPNLRTMRFTVPGGAPLAPNGPVSMIVQSHYVNTTACSLGCLDVAPNSFAWITL
jgi:hypothetical protein